MKRSSWVLIIIHAIAQAFIWFGLGVKYPTNLYSWLFVTTLFAITVAAMEYAHRRKL